MAQLKARGLALAANKAVAAAAPIRRAPAPAVAVLALDQGSGVAAEPLVRPGDRVRVGTRIAVATSPAMTAVHAPVAGRVRAVETRPTPSGVSPCVLIENDGSDDREAEPTLLDWAHLAPEALVDILRASGIAGYGGAAFPTATKLAAARRHQARHLVLNGIECEPWICCDDTLMRTRAQDVVLGARVLVHAMGAERCTLAVEDDKPEALEALRSAVTSAADSRLELVSVAACYPAGAERVLLEAVTGIEVPHDSRPPASGLLCHNVGTAAAAAAAVRGQPVTSRIVTVTGSGVAQPANVEARLGTPIADLVETCGGYAGQPIRLIAGGSMTGRALATDEVPVTIALNCALVATTGDLAESSPEFACIRCGDCATVCPPGLLPQQLLAGVLAQDAAMLRRHGLADCIECGCCDYVCPAAIPLTAHFRAAREDARTRESALRRADDLRSRYAAHLERLASASESERRAFENAREQARGRSG